MSVGIATTPTMSKMTNGIKFHKKVSISFKSNINLEEESLGDLSLLGHKKHGKIASLFEFV